MFYKCSYNIFNVIYSSNFLQELEERHRAEISRKDAELRESEKMVRQAERDRRDASETADYYSAQVESMRAKSSARSQHPSPEAASLEITRQVRHPGTAMLI